MVNRQQVAGMERYVTALYGQPEPSHTSYTLHPQISDYQLWVAVNAPIGSTSAYFQQFPDLPQNQGKWSQFDFDDMANMVTLTDMFFKDVLPELTATPYTRAASMTMDQWTKGGGDPLTWYVVREAPGQTAEQLLAKYPSLNANQQARLIDFYTQYQNPKPLTGTAQRRMDLLNRYNQIQQTNNQPTVQQPSTVEPTPTLPTPEEMTGYQEQQSQGAQDLVQEYYDLNPQEPTPTPPSNATGYTPPPGTIPMWQLAGYESEAAYNLAKGNIPMWQLAGYTSEEAYNQATGKTTSPPTSGTNIPMWQLAGYASEADYNQAMGITGGSTGGTTDTGTNYDTGPDQTGYQPLNESITDASWYKYLTGQMNQQPTWPNVPMASAQTWYNLLPSERLAYQAGITSLGNDSTWTDYYDAMQKKWPSWNMPSRAGWTAANYNKW